MVALIYIYICCFIAKSRRLSLAHVRSAIAMKKAVCAACSVRRVWKVLHVLVSCYGTNAFCDMILCCIEVLHMVVRLAVLVCWFDALFRPSLTLAMLRCFALCWHVLAVMLDMRVSTPGCRGSAYACLRLYAFDRDGVPCWPACTRLLCNDGS